MAKKLKILIADDHAIFRRGLKDIFEEHFPKVTVGEAEAGESALEQVLKAGAVGYITKMKAPPVVIKAVERVLAGGKYISPRLAERLKEQSQSSAEKLPHERLTNREYQVLCLAPSGKSLKEIAGELSISVQTVSTHRARILKKMGMNTSAELIRYALENRLVD
jgi:two-component system, NarL family, invasion response regulator UvrY